MTPYEFFHSHVLPTFEDWKKDDTAIHKAKNLATNLNQMADYFFHHCGTQPAKVLGAKNLKGFRDVLGRHCEEFSLVRDVSDGHKHCALDRKDKQVTSADQTKVKSLGFGQAKYGQGKFGSPPEVVVEDDTGRFHHFSHIAGTVVNMWEKLL